MPKLSPPAPVKFKDNIVPIEISEYAGYAGLIAANGGLEPTENSLFFKNHGFKVRLTISEDEDWSELNEGKIAASVTTVDVLAAYGRQLHAVVPAQIGFSRGADGIVVRSDIKRINAAQGQDDRDGAVHRGRLLHPLPRAGSRARHQHARQPRRGAASRQGSTSSTPRTASGPAICSCRHQVRQEPARRRGDVGAEGVGSRRRQRRPGARADDEPQPADRRRRADRAPRLRRGAAEDRRGPRRRACSKATAWCAIGRTSTSTSSAGRSSGAATTRRASWRTCTCRTCRRTSRSSPARSTRPAASTSIYQSAVLAYGSDLIKDPPDAEPLRQPRRPAGAREGRALQGSEGRDRADPLRRRRHRSRRTRS